MIKLEISQTLRENYGKWYRENKTELETHFKQYLKGLEQKNKNPNPTYQTFIQDLPENATTKADWCNQKGAIRKFLRDITPYCAYCETKVHRTGARTIDHFYPKSKFPDRAFQLENLLPSCLDCNRTKGDHVNAKENEAGPIKEIINPVEDHPKDAIYLDLETMLLHPKAGSEIGIQTLNRLKNTLNQESFPYINESGEFHDRAGALADRLALKEEIPDDCWAFYEEGCNAKLLKTYLANTINDINPSKKPFTATRATLICDGAEFRKLIHALRSDDPEGATEIEQLLETKRKYSLAP